MHTEPIREENAVHNLEHGYVILYYRADDPGRSATTWSRG